MCLHHVLHSAYMRLIHSKHEHMEMYKKKREIPLYLLIHFIIQFIQHSARALVSACNGTMIQAMTNLTLRNIGM